MTAANEVPEGTVSDVLAWVGDDPGRAQAALDYEREDQGRSTLITRLEAIASEEQENSDVTEPLPTEGEQAPAPEQPADVNIDPDAEGTVIGPIHVRDGDVEVPPDEPNRDLPAQQVEFFQAVGATNGVVLSINGTAFVFNPELAATLKGALDKMVAGLSF